LKKLALIGCGAIASEIVEAVNQSVIEAEITAFMDLAPEKCRRLQQLAPGALITRNIEELLETEPDLVVEAASQEAVRQYALRVVEAGVDLVVLSAGALLDRGLLEKLDQEAGQRGVHVYVPTGALAGLDAVRALRRAGIQKLLLRTVKPPESLGVKVNEPRVLYRGPASEAVRLYPFNVNVAAALSLAAGMEAEVEIVADPGVERNTHIVIVESKASRLEIRVENVPSPRNPRTSLLAALSTIELLRRITRSSGVEVGS